MTYHICFMVGSEVIAHEETFGPPDEGRLRDVAEQIGAEYYDICRSDTF